MEAELAFKAGRASDALRLLDRLKRERPNNPEALSVRLSVLARHGRKSQALAEAEARASKLPDDLGARLLAARVNDLCERSGPAIEHLRRAVAIAPDSLAPRVMLARVYASANRHREAEAVWSEAVDRFPGVTQLAFDLAVCREQLGDMAGAEEVARGILRRDPDNATALNFLGYLFADHNFKLDEALDLIRRALVFDPDNGAYLDSFGWACFRLGRLDEARQYLERAATLTGNDPIVLEHLGDVYKELKLNSLAREQYRRSLTADNANNRVRAKLSGLR
jgi:tetratricopeptide (TPR) repeat protein